MVDVASLIKQLLAVGLYRVHEPARNNVSHLLAACNVSVASFAKMIETVIMLDKTKLGNKTSACAHVMCSGHVLMSDNNIFTIEVPYSICLTAAPENKFINKKYE